MTTFLEVLSFNLSLILIALFWQLASEWWERRGGGAAFSRRTMIVITLVPAVFINLLLGGIIMMSG